MKTPISALIFSIAIVLGTIILGNAYFKRSKAQTRIVVTGLGETDFISDLIVLEN